jgi:kinetochore protein NDC80
MPPPQSRRMTLGVVNMNSRNSLGGGVRTETPNKAYKQKPPSGRVSMLPRVGRENIVPPSPARSVVSTTTASSRRRSVGGVDHRRASSTALIKQDPRPVTDKACQNICIKRLLEYLIKSGYDFPISQKTLNKPSGKDFANIVTFLIRKIEPPFQNGMLKLEDEIAMTFKALGYPFPVSKTALVAAGSPHTWPTLLAALTWLTEHLILIEAQKEEEANENLDKPFESLDELEGKTDKAFFNFLDGAYLAFLRGDQQQSDQLTDDLMEMVEHDNMIIERDIDRVTDLNAAFVEKMNHLSQESEP